VRREVPRLKVKFVIVGDGEMRGVLEEHARGLHLGEDVLFTGWIEDLADVYADLDVVALTSLNEGTPVSVIEAMAAGKAVIATDVGGVPDVCEDGLTGILAKRNDVGDYTSKLIALLNDAERRGQLGARARDHVKEKYSKERLVRDIEALYEGLVDQKLRKRKGSRR
jgi:glycosyltransferase involved in cell wall biosynthesis